MDKDYKNEKLQTRREFFKKAAKGVLPIIGAVTLTPFLTACPGSDPDDPLDCSDCTSACSSSCSSACSNSTTNSGCSDCANGCSSTCSGTCSNSCEGQSTGKPTTGTIDGHEYVDLGLSVLWATCDIGASSVGERGTELPFVFPDAYDTYDDERTVYWKTWYQQYVSLGLKAGTSISGTYLDTARNKWGSNWRMPTNDELKELAYKCEVEQVSGVGLKLTSKINGASIILPFSNDRTTTYWSGDTTTFKFINSDTEYLGAFTLDARSSYLYSGESYIAYHSGRNYHIRTMLIRPVAERGNGNVSSCNGTCTANCSSDCSSTCKNACGNDCTGGCKEGCSTGCKTTCTKTCADNCYSDCNTKCTTTCADVCKGQTSQSCSSCSNNCSGRCTETCADACKAQTSQSCSGCGSQCSGKCGGSCQSDCTGSCGMQCAQTCGGSCSRNCNGRCSNYCTSSSYNDTTYCVACVFACNSYCANTCSDYCYSSCRNNGKKG